MIGVEIVAACNPGVLYGAGGGGAGGSSFYTSQNAQGWGWGPALYPGIAQQFGQLYDPPQPVKQETTVATDNDAIPDVSLTRVLKWAVVLMIAMALGERFWAQFGPRISGNLHKVLGGPDPHP